MRLPKILVGSEREVCNRLDALDFSRGAGLVGSLDRDCVDVAVGVTESGPHPEMLGELLAPLMFARDGLRSLAAATHGIEWAEVGFIVAVSGWRTECDALVTALRYCASFETAVASIGRGDYSSPLAAIVRLGSDDMARAWDCGELSLGKRFSCVADRMAAASESEVVEAIIRCAMEYAAELRAAGARRSLRTGDEVRALLATLTRLEYEFARTARLSVVIDLARRPPPKGVRSGKRRPSRR